MRLRKRYIVSPPTSAELRELLRVIRAIDFEACPREWTLRGTTAGLSPGRRGGGADFVYYDPRARRRISAQRAQEFQRVYREVPDVHPVGWDHSAVRF